MKAKAVEASELVTWTVVDEHGGAVQVQLQRFTGELSYWLVHNGKGRWMIWAKVGGKDSAERIRNARTFLEAYGYHEQTEGARDAGRRAD